MRKVYWHRLLGVVLSDYLTGTRYKVEMERDLSLKQQVLDILIIEQSKGARPRELPDGLENFARYNLLTFKSLRQPLNAWALDELLGHFVNYRKQASPSLMKLLPAKVFRLYAVSMRKPKQLGRGAALTPIMPGVYEVTWGGCVIRVLVLNEMPKFKRNALWQMFSGVAEKVRYGAKQYDWRKKELSQYHNTRFNYYKQFMAYLKKLDTDAYPVFPNKSFLLFSHSTHRRQPGQDVAIAGSTCAVFGNLLDTE